MAQQKKNPNKNSPKTGAGSKAAAAIAPKTPTNLNIAAALGTISSEPMRRDLPSGSTVMALSLTVRESNQPSTSLPVVWFDAPGRADSLARGDEVLVVGRLSRRFFRSGGATQSRTELVAERIEPTRRKAGCRRMINGVEAHLEAVIAEGFL